MYFASFFGFIIYGPRYDAETVLLGKKMISRRHAGRQTSRQAINELYFEHCNVDKCTKIRLQLTCNRKDHLNLEYLNVLSLSWQNPMNGPL